MTMKTKHILLGLSLGLLGGFTACDVTDLNPKDSITDNSYWNTVSDLENYAKGFYMNLTGKGLRADGSENLDDLNTLDERSDNRLVASPDQWLFNEWVIPSEVNFDSKWYWNNIRNLNYFMTRYQRVNATESEVNPVVAVIRFFRAFDYFDKIKTFGDVPWYEKDLTTADIDELYKARDDRDFVLGKIIEDLEFAIEWLPEKSAAEVGALHKDAARTFLARVCLHYGTYKKYHNVSTSPTSQELLQKAATLAKEVMDSGLYDIVQGSDAGANQSAFADYPLYYANQFTQEDLTTNKECILARVFEADVLTHNLARGGGVGLSKDFAESFLCKDGLPIANSSEYKGDETLDDEMANRDPRMYQIIDSKYRPYTVKSNGMRVVNSGIDDKKEFSPSEEPGTNIHSAPGLTGTATGYSPIKLVSASQSQQDAVKTSSYDWFVFRYAEILLIYAEAKCELGECTQAVLDETINKLRDRVEMKHLTVSPVADLNPVDYGYSITPLLYEIRRERRIELALEGFRYDDIMRWNAMKLFENPKTYLGMRVTDKVKALYQPEVFEGSTARDLIEYNGKTYIRMYSGKSLNEAGRKWTGNDKRLYYPIPTSQITLSASHGSLLKQNPGWE